MSADVKIKIKVNDAEVKKLDAAQTKIKTIQNQQALSRGINQFSQVSGLGRGNLLGNFASKLGGLTTGVGAFATGIGLGAVAVKTWVSTMQGCIDKGQQAQDEFERAAAQLRQQVASYAPWQNNKEIAGQLQIMSENGVASVDKLTQVYANLLPAMRGTMEETLEMVAVLMDLEAAGKGSAETLANLVTKVRLHDEATEKDLKRIEREGLPIYRELARVRGEEIDATKQALKNHEVTADQMVAAIKKVGEAYKGTAKELSNTAEGAKASMEAARGRAYQGYAAGANEVRKSYYQTMQHRYDRIALNDNTQRDFAQIGRDFQTAVSLFEQTCTALKEGWEIIFGKLAGFLIPESFKLKLATQEAKSYLDAAAQIKTQVDDRVHRREREIEGGRWSAEDDLEFWRGMAQLNQQLDEIRRKANIDFFTTDERLRFSEMEKAIKKSQDSIAANAPQKGDSLMEGYRKAGERRRNANTIATIKGLDEYKKLLEKSEKTKELNTTIKDLKDATKELAAWSPLDNKLGSDKPNILAMSPDELHDWLLDYEDLVVKGREAEDDRRAGREYFAKYASLGELIDQLTSAYVKNKVAKQKDKAMGGTINDLEEWWPEDRRVTSREIPSQFASFMKHFKNKNFDVDYEALEDLGEDAQQKFAEWIRDNYFYRLTELNGVFDRFASEDEHGKPYTVEQANELLESYQEKMRAFQVRLGGKTGAEKIKEAIEAMKEIWGIDVTGRDSETIEAMIKRYIDEYNAVIDAMNESEKWATEYVESKLKKVREKREELKKEKADMLAKQMEKEQYTKSDAYNTLRAYKIRLEKETDSKGKPLYTKEEIKKLVGLKGRQMIREEKDRIPKGDDTRHVNASRAQAATGYIGRYVAGYDIRSAQNKEQSKELKTANKHLEEIKTAIKEVDATPRAV